MLIMLLGFGNGLQNGVQQEFEKDAADNFFVRVVVIGRRMAGSNLDPGHSNGCCTYTACFNAFHDFTRLHPEEIMNGHRRFHERLLRDALLSESNDENRNECDDESIHGGDLPLLE